METTASSKDKNESNVTYRTVEIAWLPESQIDWKLFTRSRLEAARLRNAAIVLHARIRRLGWKWPTKKRWEKWAKGKFPDISAQSAQQIIGEFLENVASAKALRQSQ